MIVFFCSEKASLAVTLVNANNDVMGHAAFFDYPNLPSVDQSKWEEWLHTKYDCDKCNVCNVDNNNNNNNNNNSNNNNNLYSAYPVLL